MQDCRPAQDIDDSAAAALACGTEIEILDQRSPWDTSYATPEGNLRVQSSSTAIRTDINGSWQAIDTTLTDTGDGIRPAAAVHDLVFSDGTPGVPMATMTIDGHTLTMDAPVALTTAQVDGSTITYPGVLDDIDLVLQVNPDGTGFSEVLRVNTPEAATDPALEQLEFALDTSPGLTLSAAGEGFTARDAAGQDVFVSPAPIMWDSASTQLPPAQAAAVGAPDDSAPSTFAATDEAAEGEPAPETLLQPADGDAVAAMDAELSADSVTIEPDQDLLTDPGTVYPVYIDPSVDNGSRNGRTVVRAGFPTDTSLWNFSGDQGLGYCSTSGGCDRNGAYRMFYSFDSLPAVSAADADEIVEASFSIYGQHSWSCTGTGVELWRTGSISSSTTWNNQPTWAEKLQTKTLSHKDTCGTQRWIEWDATAAAENMASTDRDYVTFGMQTTNETSMASSWQRYRNDVTFSVTYSRTPTAPTGLYVDSKACPASGSLYIDDATPQLRWRISDPDGGNVAGKLNIINLANGNSAWSRTTNAYASGSEVSTTVPSGELSNGGSYEWRVNGIDTSTGAAGPITKCRFIIDTTPPGAPEVTVSATTRPARYEKDQVGGGIGLQGRFRIEGASDVVSFKYAFNSDTPNIALTADDGVAGLDFTPTTAGSQRLVVQAFDRAANSSTVTLYRFSVAFPSVTAKWHLNDGTGTSGLDSTGTNNLSVTSTTQWVNGVYADLAAIPGDTALRFDSANDYAQASRAAVNTGTSYTVSAFVNLDTLGTDTQTALSQPGQFSSAFQIGTLPTASCTAAGATCWFAQVKTYDTSTGNTITARSTTAATTDHWYHLTATVDLVNNQLSLYVCDPEGAANPNLAATETIAPGVTWAAGGKTQVGRTAVGGVTDNIFPGTIDDVRVYDNVQPLDDIRQSCEGNG